MTAVSTELQWETLDPEAPYPETVYRAAGSRCEYLIAWFRPDRDRKFDRGESDNWTLSSKALSVTDPFGAMGWVGYYRSLDEAKAAAQRWEDKRRDR